MKKLIRKRQQKCLIMMEVDLIIIQSVWRPPWLFFQKKIIVIVIDT